MSGYTFKYLQPAQHGSRLKKIDDPDWCEHRYRDNKDRAMTSAIRELRNVLAQRAELLEALKELLFASAGLVEDKYLRDVREVIAKAEGR